MVDRTELETGHREGKSFEGEGKEKINTHCNLFVGMKRVESELEVDYDPQ